MGRLPFDPTRMQGPERPAPDAPLTVTQLAARVKGVLDAGFPSTVRVVGEISGFSDRTHWYFSLKDAGAVINCVMFASAAKKAGFSPAQGQQVVVKGRVEYYAPQGKVTVIVERMEPVGAGARELALKQLIEDVRALGWLAPERKRALPTFPRRIAVVTSESGAALQDVLVTMRRRCPAVGVLVVDVRVQGDRTVPEVVRALTHLSRHAASLGIDAILLTRGGGSAEDLWAFNDRSVAQAVVNCSVPVVAAIGHETDTSLAELVADERCATPTQAAMRLTPDAADLRRQVLTVESRLALFFARHLRDERQQLAHAGRSLRNGVESRILRARSHANDLSARLSRRSPAAIHARMVARLETASAALARALRAKISDDRAETHARCLTAAIGRRLELASQSTHSIIRHLEAIGPLRVLDRGYSVTLRSDGRVVRTPNDVGPGEAIQTRVAQGVIRSVVWDTAQSLPAPPPPATKPAKPKAKQSNPGSPGLFG